MQSHQRRILIIRVLLNVSSHTQDTGPWSRRCDTTSHRKSLITSHFELWESRSGKKTQLPEKEIQNSVDANGGGHEMNHHA